MPAAKKEETKEITRPQIVLSVKTVPNYTQMYSKLRANAWRNAAAFGTEAVLPGAKEVREYEDSLREKTAFLPLPYQKIVAVGMICSLPGKEKKYLAITGEESFILRRAWAHINSCWPKGPVRSYNRESEFPSIVTCDNKRLSLPLLINRSLLLYKKLEGSSLAETGRTIAERIAAGEEVPAFYNDIENIRTGLAQILDKNDKWEKSRPNYMNRYSNYSVDLAAEYNLEGGSIMDSQTVESLVSGSSWDRLSDFMMQDLLEDYRNYLIGLRITEGIVPPADVFKLTSAKELAELVNREHYDPRVNPCDLNKILRENNAVRAAARAAAAEKAKEETKKQEAPAVQEAPATENTKASAETEELAAAAAAEKKKNRKQETVKEPQTPAASEQPEAGAKPAAPEEPASNSPAEVLAGFEEDSDEIML